MSTEALKLALRVLSACLEHPDADDAIAAIKAALAAPVQEPVSVYRLTKLVDGVWTPATEWNTGYPDPDWEELEKTDGLWKIQRRVTGQQIADGLAKAFAAQPAPVQEPVAICRVYPLRGHESIPTTRIEWIGGKPVAGPLYATPHAAPVQQKPLFADLIAQHPGLAEELKAMDAAPVQEPVARVWDEGYRAGIDDERTSEANIGIAGMGMKVEPARNNPYRSTCAGEIMKIKMTALELILHLSDGSTTPNTLQHIAKIAKATLDAMKEQEEMQPFKDMTDASYLRGVRDGREAAQRWVGLTDDEKEIINGNTWDVREAIYMTEAKLKEKNHG